MNDNMMDRNYIFREIAKAGIVLDEQLMLPGLSRLSEKLFANSRNSEKFCNQLAKHVFKRLQLVNFDLLISQFPSGIIWGYELSKYFDVQFLLYEENDSVFTYRYDQDQQIITGNKVLLVESLVCDHQSLTRSIDFVENDGKQVKAVACFASNCCTDAVVYNTRSIPVISLIDMTLDKQCSCGEERS
jgi:orotate phosphoribosyltransferase